MGTDLTKALSLKDTITILVQHFDLHEGLWDLAFEVQVGIGAFGPTPENRLPGAAIGIGGLKLIRSKQAGPHTVDAAVVNPAPRRPARRASAR